MPEDFWIIELRKWGRDMLYIKGYREYVEIEGRYRILKVMIILYIAFISVLLYGGFLRSFFWKWIYLLFTCFFLFSAIFTMYSENLSSIEIKKQKDIEIRNHTKNFAEILKRASEGYKLSKNIVENKIVEIYAMRISKRMGISLFEAKKLLEKEFMEKIKSMRELNGEKYLNAVENIISEIEEGYYGYRRSE